MSKDTKITVDFERSDFLRIGYVVNDNILEKSANSTKLDMLITAMYHLSDIYANYVIRHLSVIYQIEKFGKNKKYDEADDLRRNLCVFTNNTIMRVEKEQMIRDVIDNIVKIDTCHQKPGFPFFDPETKIQEEFYLSFKDVNVAFMNLLHTLKIVFANPSIVEWKKSYDKIENDILVVYKEFIAFENVFASAFFSFDGISKLEFIRDNGGRKDLIKIKKNTDIVDMTYELIKTLNEVYKVVTETKIRLLEEANIVDPDWDAINFNYDLSEANSIYERDIDNESHKSNSEDEVEDFIDPDQK